jgi:hydrogenase nickel incorporation protein HypA/HybF
MHETALMQNLIGSITHVLEGRKTVRINRVVLSVGKLSNALPEALKFAFEAFSQEGILKGAKLEIKDMPAEARCDDCCHEYIADVFPIVCPVCKSTGFRIIKGEEVYIEYIDCEDE